MSLKLAQAFEKNSNGSLPKKTHHDGINSFTATLPKPYMGRN